MLAHGVYQVNSPNERIKLCPVKAKKSPIDQTLASSAGTAELSLNSTSILSNSPGPSKTSCLNQGQGGMCIRLRRGIGLGIWQECFGP